jgi:uncharacterized membrane protein YcfT
LSASAVHVRVMCGICVCVCVNIYMHITLYTLKHTFIHIILYYITLLYVQYFSGTKPEARQLDKRADERG